MRIPLGAANVEDARKEMERKQTERSRGDIHLHGNPANQRASGCGIEGPLEDSKGRRAFLERAMQEKDRAKFD